MAVNIAIVGSRKFRPVSQVSKWIGEHFREDWHIISGGAGVVDCIAAEIAAIHGDFPEEIRPDYKRFPPNLYGKDFAPKWRNRQIATQCDRMIVFWDGRSTGTAHAVAWASFFKKSLTIILSEQLGRYAMLALDASRVPGMESPR